MLCGKSIVNRVTFKLLFKNYYPSWETGGHSCNLPPIYEEMALKCLFTH